MVDKLVRFNPFRAFAPDHLSHGRMAPLGSPASSLVDPLSAAIEPDRFEKSVTRNSTVLFGHLAYPYGGQTYGYGVSTPAGHLAYSVPLQRQPVWPVAMPSTPAWQSTPPSWSSSMQSSAIDRLIPAPHQLAPCLWNVHVPTPQPVVTSPRWPVSYVPAPSMIQQPYAPTHINIQNQPASVPVPAWSQPIQQPLPQPPPMQSFSSPSPEPKPPPVDKIEDLKPPALNPSISQAERDLMVRFPNGQTLSAEEMINLFRQLQQIQRYFHSTNIRRRQDASVNLSMLIEHYPSLYEPPSLDAVKRDVGTGPNAAKAKQFMDLIAKTAMDISMDVIHDDASEVRFPLLIQYKVGRLSYMPPAIEKSLDKLTLRRGMYNFEPSHILAIKRRFVNGRPRWESEPRETGSSYSSSPIGPPEDWTPVPKVMQPTSEGSQEFPITARTTESPLFKPSVDPSFTPREDRPSEPVSPGQGGG